MDVGQETAEGQSVEPKTPLPQYLQTQVVVVVLLMA